MLDKSVPTSLFLSEMQQCNSRTNGNTFNECVGELLDIGIGLSMTFVSMYTYIFMLYSFL